ncbi:Flp pilus assembly protein CpaB (plasmid) [Klebsiella sp. WOUb02]|uniref:Flp pilus assembly protein CpaB n=1 Tax=Klebsiella sp. WOUb02 TaxID=3161071 RepID=UPI003CF48CBC
MRIKRNSTLLLSGACIFAAIVALMVRNQLSEAPPEPPQVYVPEPKNMVLIAGRDLKPGDFIDPSSLIWQETDLPVSRTFNFIRGKDSEVPLFGATVREMLPAGTPLNSNILVRPNEPGFIAAVLHKGMRAISIPTNAVASNSGLVAAGDRVDIILSLRKDDQPDSSTSSSGSTSSVIPLLAAQTIVRDLRVLALNNQTDTDIRPRQDVEDEPPTTARNASKKSRVTPSYQTVTVEVTPEQAEILAVAKEVGMLHLALRSTEDDVLPTEGSVRVTTLSDSTRIYSGLGSGGGHQVKLFRGDKKETRSFPSR